MMFERFKRWIAVKLGYIEVGMIDNAHPESMIHIVVKIKRDSTNHSYFTYKGREYLIN